MNNQARVLAALVVGMVGSSGLAGIGEIAFVSGRHVFYNNSVFDGNDTGANAQDDNAIALDKEALLPGGTASFANYTSYSGGINGVMVDIVNLADPFGLVADDFNFRIGNDDTPDDWAVAPPPATLAVRLGAGIDGSDRVTIVWPDNAIDQQWLQTTVKANGTTGLNANDVFFFGNAIGETDDSDFHAIVNLGDVGDIENNFSDLTDIADRYDIDRNGLVNSADADLARDHLTDAGTSLRLLGGPPIPEPTTLTILSLGGLMLARRQHRQTA